MELLIFRHGLAGSKEDWAACGRPDSERPLTKEGRRKTKEAVKGLARLTGADIVATSPWLRATQTAEILADALGAEVVETESLIPDRAFGDFLAWLKTRQAARLAAVGHEPHLSRLTSWLMTGRDHPVLELKKSHVVLLRLERLAPGAATLVWSLPPKVLRDLSHR